MEKLSSEDMALLRELLKGPKSIYDGNPRKHFDRLIALKYVNVTPLNTSDLRYEITALGRKHLT